MKSLLFNAAAAAELDSAIQWYESRQRGLGLALHAEVQRVLDRIGQSPASGTRYQSTVYSFVRTRRFPYVVYYWDRDDAVWIMAVAHARQRPDYWQQRLHGTPRIDDK